VIIETEMQSNASNAFTQNGTAGQSSTPLATDAFGSTTNAVAFTERLAAVSLAGEFGAVNLGQLAAATDGVYTQDLVGAQDIMNSDTQKIGGGINLRGGNGTLSGITINSMTFSGSTKRNDGIRYDSPKMGGFQGKASITQGGDTDLGVFYDSKLGDFKVKGAAAVEFNNDTASNTANTVEQRYIASGSVLHSSGFGGTVAYTTDKVTNNGSEDPMSWYAKGGYAWDKYELAADYGQANHYGNTILSDNKLTFMGVGAQYNLGNGVSLAGLYRNFDADRSGTELQSVDLFAANMRVKF
jgi:hypothetical protein